MEERLEQLVSQFGNSAEIDVKVGRSKIWPLREGRVISPEWVDKFELAINEPDQLNGTVNVSRGGETIYRVSRGTVDIDEREALEFLTEIESLPEAVNELEPQPEYLELLNSRLERVGQEGWTLDELRTDVEQGRAESGNSFVSSFDDIVIREGLERGLSQEQTLAVLDRSPTLEGQSADEVIRYRTQFETQYNGESVRQSRIQENRDFTPEAKLQPENEAVQDVLEPEDSNAISVDEDMGFPEDLPEDENLIQDEGITFAEVAEIEDIEPEDSALPAESLESFDIASSETGLGEQGDSVPEDVPEPVEQIVTEPETVIYPGLDADLTREVLPAESPAIFSTPEPNTEALSEFGLTPEATLDVEGVGEEIFESAPISATPSTYADLLTSYTQREPGYFDNEFTPEFVEAKLNTPDPIVPSNPQAFGESIDRWVMTEAISQGLSREDTLNLVVEQSPYVAKLSSKQDMNPKAFETYLAPGGSLDQELDLVLNKVPEQTLAPVPVEELSNYKAQQSLEHPQSLETVQPIETIGENSPDLAVALSDVTETSTHEPAPESIPAFHTVEPLSESLLVQAVSSDQSTLRHSPYLATTSENSQIVQIVESINKPLDIPLDPQAQQAALTVHFSALPDAITPVEVLNGALASAEPRLQSLQDGFTAVEFEIKNLAQHINEGKFSDWASSQGKRLETAAQTMTENVKGRFGQWVDNAKSAVKDKVQGVGHTLMEKFEKAVALVDSNKLETVAPILPPQVENYKIETEQGLRISRDGVPIYEDGKCTPNISTWDAVFIGRLSERAEKNVSSMVEGLATLGGEVQPNGDRAFSVGTYTMSRSENGAVKLSEASRGEILHAQNGKIRSTLTAEDFSRFQKFHQNTQVAVKAPAMAKGGMELG